jgi:hypothetical protein
MATPANSTAHNAWANGTAPTGKITAHGGSDGPSHFTVAGTHVYTTAGTYTTRIAINDDRGSYSTAYGSANVTTASTLAPVGAATTVSLDPLTPSWVMDEALASLEGASKPRHRWAAT